VNRLSGEKGFCQAGGTPRVAYCGLHHGEEPPISGARGSGTLFFGHCTMACVFCQNWQISHPDTSAPLEDISIEKLAAVMLGLQRSGAHNINLVSPTQHAPWLYQAWLTAKAQGLVLPVVYNTNGYERIEILEPLDEMIDIYLPDLKYAGNISAGKYSHTPDYAGTALAAVQFMLKQKGRLKLQNGLAARGVLVRHLVLPGLARESRKILDELYALDPEIHLSLMSQYAPQHEAKNIPELNRRLSAEEYNEIVEYAAGLGLANVWIQETASQEILVPDFCASRPFQ
jgi:putative pyruvate formate lyase activating enzyme